MHLRRGNKRPPRGCYPDKYERMPAAHRPFQGGQNYFQDFLLKRANRDISKQRTLDSMTDSGRTEEAVHVQSPFSDFASNRTATEDEVQREMKHIMDNDGFVADRSFNEKEWYVANSPNHELPTTNGDESIKQSVPSHIVGEDHFKEQFGYSLLKTTELPVTMQYSQLDLWSELPKYTRSTYFLYVVARRRNNYCVCYNYDGKRMLPCYSAGNRGLKGGDKGWKAEGTIDVGHQVASQYLNDLIPKIREAERDASRTLQKGDKVDVVVRVMGFYNSRVGSMRAISDRSDFFNVRFIEDVTPVPLNGPNMPKAVFK